MKKPDKTFTRGIRVCKTGTDEVFIVCKVYDDTAILSNEHGTVCLPACRWHEYEALSSPFTEGDHMLPDAFGEAASSPVSLPSLQAMKIRTEPTRQSVNPPTDFTA